MYLKHFSLISPAIQNGEVLKAIEVAISPETIEKAITQTKAQEKRIRSLPAPKRSLSSNCHEYMVNRLNARCTQEFSRWSSGVMGEGGEILASAM